MGKLLRLGLAAILFLALGVVGIAVGGCQSVAAEPPADKVPINFEEIITRAKERVFPALVFVKPISETYEGGKKERTQVFGSGVIISPDGVVVTNHHVVDKSIEINCVLWNKEQVPATLIGQDMETDLAVVQLKWGREEPLPFAKFADSDKLTEGQFVMALGAPFGFTRSISLGIISHTQRYIGFRTIYKYNTWLQTDASIDPGNSGGPLVDSKGFVVGINTLGVWTGIMGFAIPSNDVQRIVAKLQRDGEVERAWTGMDLQALKDFDSNTFIESDDGVLIKGVEEGSPAERAGLATGDILLRVNGEEVHGMYVEQLPGIRWTLAELPLEAPAAISVRRGEQTLEVSLTPVQKGAVEGEDFDCRRWNMTVKGIAKDANPSLYYYRKKGVFVRAVRYPGNADDAGIKANDIILKIGPEPIESIEDVKRVYDALMADEQREKKILGTVLRGGMQRLMVLDYRKDYEKED